ncbi:hypothetical protein LP43_1273 [Methylophaga thiooxydans]|uniref:Uncharacterized protein n=1 Tax=Methylophaga thiooxydans TaxID=392484 RepID=A0A0A0BFT8_9GAMM|nr:hypothetical protein [Methylophaga thiooxydans]KGM06781.1 hypothetical protein LP43_1273 [Methylophaga thiooxydans]
MKYVIFSCFIFISASASSIALADAITDVKQLQKDWAQTNYKLTDTTQQTAFKTLVEQATSVVNRNPDTAEAFIWRGIIQSSYAGAKGGLGALSLAKAAKADFEQAMTLNDKALNGSAYTSLGTLYFKVPGWPLGFGDDDKAETLLKKALTINPEGIDSNYFYGQFLYENRQYELAERYLLKAQQAPARPDRPLADEGRHKEIEATLQQLQNQLNTKKHAGIIN